MAGRYEISDHGWDLIEDIVSPAQTMGRPRRDDRQVLNGIFWILCSGAKWRDLPKRYGPWKTVYDRFRKWRDDGTFEAILARLQLRLREDGLMDLDTWMIDSTSIRATRAASGGGKKGAPRTRRPCPGAQPRRSDDQDPHGVRSTWLAADLHVVTGSGLGYAALHADHGECSPAWPHWHAAQALPLHRGG